MPAPHRDHDLISGEHAALVDLVSRVLDKGAVIAGEVVIAVADIDLVRLELQLVLGSTQALTLLGKEPAEGG
jgi:hypothetical protein